MGDPKKRAHAAILGGIIVVILSAASPSAWGDPVPLNDLKVVSGDQQNVAVTEGKGGDLSWTIENTGAEAITLNKKFIMSMPVFDRTGGDDDDDVKVTAIAGCDGNVAAKGGQCTVVVSFITPFEADTTPDENSDRGFWDLLATDGTFPMVSGKDALGNAEISSPLRGHVEVDDPGVKAITPESPTIVTLGLGFLAFGLARWTFKESSRNRGVPPAGL